MVWPFANHVGIILPKSKIKCLKPTPKTLQHLFHVRPARGSALLHQTLNSLGGIRNRRQVLWHNSAFERAQALFSSQNKIARRQRLVSSSKTKPRRSRFAATLVMLRKIALTTFRSLRNIARPLRSLGIRCGWQGVIRRTWHISIAHTRREKQCWCRNNDYSDDDLHISVHSPELFASKAPVARKTPSLIAWSPLRVYSS
jgi:hypothetical protein